MHLNLEKNSDDKISIVILITVQQNKKRLYWHNVLLMYQKVFLGHILNRKKGFMECDGNEWSLWFLSIMLMKKKTFYSVYNHWKQKWERKALPSTVS